MFLFSHNALYNFFFLDKGSIQAGQSPCNEATQVGTII